MPIFRSSATIRIVSHPLPLPLLATKLYLPHLRPALVTRPRLLRLLDAAGTEPLTLVSAPAGFGKTTLVAAWAQQQSLPVAWLSLDAADNDPNRFLRYLIAALQTQQPEIGRDLLQATLSLPLPTGAGRSQSCRNRRTTGRLSPV